MFTSIFRPHQQRLYWWVHGRGQRLRTLASRLRRAVANSSDETRLSSLAVVQVLARSLVGLGASGSLVAAGQILASWLDVICGGATNSCLKASGGRIVSSLARTLTPSAYEQLLVAVVTVAATLLALYFASLGVIVSTTYSAASDTLRRAFVRTRAGNTFTRVSGLTILAGLEVLFLPVVDIDVRGLTVAAIAVLAAMSLAALARLAVGLFDFLDPVNLLRADESTIRQIIKSLPGVTAGEDNQRIAATRQIAARALNRMQSASEWIQDRHAHSGAYMDSTALPLVHLVGRCWYSYSVTKPYLAQDSTWFGTKPQYTDWFRAGFEEIGSASATRTVIGERQVPDSMWFERAAAHIIATSLTSLSPRSRATALGQIAPLIGHLSRAGMFEEGRLLLTLFDDTLEQLLRPEARPSPSATDEPGSALVAADAVGFARIVALLGLVELSETVATDFPEWTVEEVRARKTTRTLAPGTRRVIIAIKDAAAFEQSVEGQRRTPDFVIHQLVARALASEVSSEVRAVTGDLRRASTLWLGNERREVLPDDVRAVMAQRLDEAAHKLNVHLGSIQRLLTLCESVHRDVDDTWPDTDISAEASQLLEVEATVTRTATDLAASMDLSFSDAVPDHAGWAYHRMVDGVTEQLLRRDTSATTETWASVIAASQRAMARTARSIGPQHPTVVLHYAGAPMFTLLQLSGLALLLSRLFRDERLSLPATDAWTLLLRSHPQLAHQAVAAIEGERSLFALTPPGILHTSWESRISQNLAERGVTAPLIGPRLPGDDDWIKVAIREVHRPLGDMARLFAASFLIRATEHLGIGSIDFPADVMDLCERLERADAVK